MSTTIAFNDGSGGPSNVSDVNPLPVVIADAQGPLPSVQSQSTIPANDAHFILAPRRYTSQAAEASAVIYSGRCVIYGLAGYSAKASAQFIQIFDAAALPADGGIPIFSIIVPASSNFSIDFGGIGLSVSGGFVVSNSSTVATKTIGSADCQFFGRYKP